MGAKQEVYIPLGSGIRTDVADNLLPLGKDLELENLQFDQIGSVVKRFGHIAQSISIPAQSSALQPIWQIATHKKARTSLSYPSSQNPIATFSPADSGWNVPITAKHGPVLTALTKMKTNGNAPRIAAGAGFYFLLYLDIAVFNTMHIDMVDASTGHLVSGQTFVVGGLSAVAAYDVIFCNGFAIAVTYESTGNIVFRTLTPSTKAISTTTFAVGTSSQAMDVISFSGATISVVYMNAAFQAAGVDFNPALLTTNAFAIHDASAAAIPLDLGRVAWVTDLGVSNKAAVATVSTTQGLRVQWNIGTGGATRTATATYNVDPSITANVVQLTAYTTGTDATGAFATLASISAGGSPSPLSLTRIGSRNAGVLQGPNVLFRSLNLISKAWTENNGFYALFSYVDVNQDVGNSYVMQTGSRASGQPTLPAHEAIFGVGNTGNTDQTGLVINAGLASVIATSATTFVTAISFLQRIGAQATGGFGSTSLGIELVNINHTQPTATPATGPPVEIFDSLVVPGGAINQFDGIGYGELGFAYSPPQPSLVSSPGGALTGGATYWYVAVYARMDNQGRLWRSGVSIPISVTLAGGDSQVTATLSTLRVTGWSTNVIELYRGAANDENLFQKVGQIKNDVTVDTVNFIDDSSDVALASGEEIYTGQNDNAILNNDTIPGSPFVFVFQNRVWFVSADNPTELWFSNIISPGNGVRFNSQNIVRVDDAHGPVYSAAAMDDKVIAVKADAVYSWAGDGPDDAGNGGYAPPQIVTLGIGSSNPRGILSTRDGVMIQSTADRPGYQMIDRGLSVANAPDGSDFGGAVQKYTNEQIMSVIMIPEQSQVRFYGLSGRVLVYDLTAKAWSTFLLSLAGDQVVSAIYTNGGALVATAAPAVWLEDTTGATYTDAGNSYGERIATPWVSNTAINGFERLMKMIGSGKTMGDHALTISKYHNYDDNTLIESKAFAETLASTPLWNWEWIPRFQRMGAVKLVLSEVSTTAGFKAEGVALWMGLRQGLNRQATTTRGP